MPTFNCGRFLRDAIESVLAQDFRDFELIIRDDASTDDSARVIGEYAARDPRIRACIRTSNLGMVENWNDCLQDARGEYVKFIFGDDALATPQSLSALVTALDSAPGAVLAASARLLLDDSSRPLGVCNDFRTAGRHDGIAVVRQCLSTDRNLIGEPSAVLFRRDTSQRGFDPQLRQAVDQEFWFHLLLQGDFMYLPEPLCIFRQHGGQQTHVNRRVEVGPMESLLITLRYIDAVSNPACGGFTAAGRRQLLFNRLYYSRKNVSRSPGILMAEAAVRARLPRRWRLLLWARHRVIKPWLNLRRFVARHFGNAPAAYTDFERIGRSLARARPAPAGLAHEGAARPSPNLTRRQLSPAASPRASGLALRAR